MLDPTVTIDQVIANTPMPIAVRSDAYWSVGGHDETFFGWGGEDLEFLSRMRTRRFSDGGLLPVVHLWHPPAANKASGDRNRKVSDWINSIPAEQRIETLIALSLGGLRPAPRSVPQLLQQASQGSLT
jgi:hypothetical protein